MGAHVCVLTRACVCVCVTYPGTAEPSCHLVMGVLLWQGAPPTAGAAHPFCSPLISALKRDSACPPHKCALRTQKMPNEHQLTRWIIVSLPGLHQAQVKRYHSDRGLQPCIRGSATEPSR